MAGTDAEKIYDAIDDVVLKGYEMELEQDLIEAEKRAAKLERLSKLKNRVSTPLSNPWAIYSYAFPTKGQLH